MIGIKSTPFYLITIALLIGISAKTLFSGGMFMDGLWYSVISRNISIGFGSFWDLSFSKTVYLHFHEHPPLAFGLQSLFFDLFGESILVERFYSLFTFLITGWIIVLIWRRVVIEKFKNLGWLPLLFWVTIPLINWSLSNNLLENTMMIFTSLSILFMLKSTNKARFLNLLLAGVMIFLGLLTKGPVALFTLSFPFWIYIFNKDYGFKKFILDTFILIAAILFSFGLLFIIEPLALDSLIVYFNKQVVTSIKSVRYVDSRFYIVWNTITNLIPAVIILVLSYVFLKTDKEKSSNNNWSWIFIALGFSGVIPIMITLKQSSFYILASMPFFSIAIAYLVAPRALFLYQKIVTNDHIYKRFKGVVYIVFILSIVVSVVLSNKIDRDEVMISDVRKVIEVVDENSVIGLQKELFEVWTLHGYFQRYAKISLDVNNKFDDVYFLVSKGYESSQLTNYNKLSMNLEMFDLYMKAKN